MSKEVSLWIEVVKAVLKPGYLYGIGEYGELYCVEIDHPPRPGERVYIITAKE